MRPRQLPSARPFLRRRWFGLRHRRPWSRPLRRLSALRLLAPRLVSLHPRCRPGLPWLCRPPARSRVQPRRRQASPLPGTAPSVRVPLVRLPLPRVALVKVPLAKVPLVRYPPIWVPPVRHAQIWAARDSVRRLHRRLRRVALFPCHVRNPGSWPRRHRRLQPLQPSRPQGRSLPGRRYLGSKYGPPRRRHCARSRGNRPWSSRSHHRPSPRKQLRRQRRLLKLLLQSPPHPLQWSRSLPRPRRQRRCCHPLRRRAA